MSDEEKISFKKIEKTGVRISVMQGITLISVLCTIFLWLNSRDEKQLIDGMSLHNQIKDLATEVRNTHVRDSVNSRRTRISDSISTLQRRQSDSVNLAGRFANLRYFINAGDRRLNTIERKLHITFVEEIKHRGPEGPVSLKSVTN